MSAVSIPACKSASYHNPLLSSDTWQGLTPSIEPFQLKDSKGNFVTVVSIEGEEAMVQKGTHSKTQDHTKDQRKKGFEKPPQPTPRQFVTVVAVGEASKLSLKENARETVENDAKVTFNKTLDYVNSETVEEWKKQSCSDVLEADQIVVYRLPGEHLGLGLKFDGGSGEKDRIKRVFIQSISEDSPASRATVPWGHLRTGDQILNIEGKPVMTMTRSECVSLLKDASLKIIIGILQGSGVIPALEKSDSESSLEDLKFSPGSTPASEDLKKRATPPSPPPLPPRLVAKKSPARPPKDTSVYPLPPKGFGDCSGDSEMEPVKKCYHERVRGMDGFVPNDSEGQSVPCPKATEKNDQELPPTAAIYLDLLGIEDESGNIYESESDETNSSASTVIDRLSLCSSSTVSRNSSFNTSADLSKFDLAKALSPFEKLEQELETETPHSCSPHKQQLQLQLSKEEDGIVTEQADDQVGAQKSASQKVKQSFKSLSMHLKGRPFTKATRNAQALEKPKLLGGTGKKQMKRPAPLPPSQPKDEQEESDTTFTVDNLKDVSYLKWVSSDDDSSDYIDLLEENDDPKMFCNTMYSCFQHATLSSPLDESTLEYRLPNQGKSDNELEEANSSRAVTENSSNYVKGENCDNLSDDYDCDYVRIREDAVLASPLSSQSALVADVQKTNNNDCCGGDNTDVDDDDDDGVSLSDENDVETEYEDTPKYLPSDGVQSQLAISSRKRVPIPIVVTSENDDSVQILNGESLPQSGENQLNSCDRHYEFISDFESWGDSGISRRHPVFLNRIAGSPSENIYEVIDEDEEDLYYEIKRMAQVRETLPDIEEEAFYEELSSFTEGDDLHGTGPTLERGHGIEPSVVPMPLNKEESLGTGSATTMVEEEKFSAGFDNGSEATAGHASINEVKSGHDTDSSSEYYDEVQPKSSGTEAAAESTINTSVDDSHEEPAHICKQVRSRKDLVELLKRDLNLKEDLEDLEAKEEEDELESVLEGETVEELALVLRALKNHEPFSLHSEWTAVNVDGSEGVASGVPSSASWSYTQPDCLLQESECRRKLSPSRQGSGEECLLSASREGSSQVRASTRAGGGRVPGASECQARSPTSEGVMVARVAAPPVGVELHVPSSVCRGDPGPPHLENDSPAAGSAPEAAASPSEGDLTKGTSLGTAEVLTNNSNQPSSDEDEISSSQSEERESSALSPWTDSENSDMTMVAVYDQGFGGSSGVPPSYSRLPPDGHEFPPKYAEGSIEKMTRYSSYGGLSMESSKGIPEKPSSVCSSSSNSPPLKSYSRNSAKEAGNTKSSFRWRRQDEKSEKSVKDKIAMFSFDSSQKTKRRKTEKSCTSSSSPASMKRAFTEDDVRLEASLETGHQSSDRCLGKASEFSSMINVSSSMADKDPVKQSSSVVDVRDHPKTSPCQNNQLLERYGSEESSDTIKLHSLNGRSQSLIDVGKPSRIKRHSFGSYDKSSLSRYGLERSDEHEKRLSLTNMIEQRRRSMNKLRGLVIPESKANEGCDRPPIDLPRIPNVLPPSTIKGLSLSREEGSKFSSYLHKTDSISSIESYESNTSKHSSVNTPSWKTQSSSLMPKQSPVLTSKSYSVGRAEVLPPSFSSRASVRSSSPASDISIFSSTSLPSPPKSLDETTPLLGENLLDYSRRRNSNTYLSHKTDSHLKADDSDNDSAVSSTQSSFSQGLSPPPSPVPEQCSDQEEGPPSSGNHLHATRNLDEVDSKRILKKGSIEAESRRNVLNLAKCSSGRIMDQSASSELVRRYSSDSCGGESQSVIRRLESIDMHESPPRLGLLRQRSSESSVSSTSSRVSDLLRRSSKDSTRNLEKMEERTLEAEAVYFDKEGDMYKESQIKVAYFNEIIDNFEELEPEHNKVIAEIQLSARAEDGQHFIHSPHGDKWAALEMKYGFGSSENHLESRVQKAKFESNVVSNKTANSNFKALANKWKQRAEEDASPPQPQSHVLPSRHESITRLESPIRPSFLFDPVHTKEKESQSQSSNLHEHKLSPGQEYMNTDSSFTKMELSDRKLSMPEYSNGRVKMREKTSPMGMGDAPSRPTSLIEGSECLSSLDSETHYLVPTPLSPTVSTDSREDLDVSLSRTCSKEVLDAFSKSKSALSSVTRGGGASCTPRMADIIRAFERQDFKVRGPSHLWVPSTDSTASDDGSGGAHYGSVTSLASGQRDQYGSITSLASSTSIISSQELAQLIEDANHSLEESGTPSHEILVVVLHREVIGHGSIGITLAGGADYETKEITVHKIIPGSLADRDGRVQRGDRVLSINGKPLRGVSHREALAILKAPRPEVVLVLSRSRSVTPQESSNSSSGSFVGPSFGGDADPGFSHRSFVVNHMSSPRPPKILESPMDSKSLASDMMMDAVPRAPPLTIALVKDGAGLGFSLEGGKDSPLGDRPLTVKKIFSGGAADKGGILKVGDELQSINNVEVTCMARIEAWNFLKKLPDGTVSLVIRQKLEEEGGEASS